MVHHAAKADLIISQQQEPITANDTRALARQLGRQMNDDEVERAIRVLHGVDRIADPRVVPPTCCAGLSG